MSASAGSTRQPGESSPIRSVPCRIRRSPGGSRAGMILPWIRRRGSGSARQAAAFPAQCCAPCSRARALRVHRYDSEVPRMDRQNLFSDAWDGENEEVGTRQRIFWRPRRARMGATLYELAPNARPVSRSVLTPPPRSRVGERRRRERRRSPGRRRARGRRTPRLSLMQPPTLARSAHIRAALRDAVADSRRRRPKVEARTAAGGARAADGRRRARRSSRLARPGGSRRSREAPDQSTSRVREWR